MGFTLLATLGVVNAVAGNGACAIHDVELATLGETGEFVSLYLLPLALTEAQQAGIQHGAIDDKSVETYFWVDEDSDLTDEDAVDRAQEMVAMMHVDDVKKGVFTS